MKMEDGNSAALRQHMRDQDDLDRNAKLAEPQYNFIMSHLDGDDILGAFEELSRDEIESLCEDLGHGDMRDMAHAGMMISDALERFAMKQAIQQVSEAPEPEVYGDD